MWGALRTAIFEDSPAMDQTGEAVAAHWSIGSECEESPTHECIKTNSFDERTSIHVRDNEGDDNQSMTQANLPENQEMYNTFNEQQLKAESFLKEEFGASEHILDYYSCALQRGILLQGWMYITYSSMCFYANIMGAITKEAFSFSDVTNITKVTQALVNPGIQFTLRDSSEVEIFSFIDRDIAFELCVHVWDFKRMNMLSPTEVLNGQQGPCLGAVLPTFQLVLQRWRQFAVADAFRSWCLRAMAHCMTARTQQQAFCSWWRQVLTVAGMDEAKMRACVLQR